MASTINYLLTKLGIKQETTERSHKEVPHKVIRKDVPHKVVHKDVQDILDEETMVSSFFDFLESVEQSIRKMVKNRKDTVTDKTGSKITPFSMRNLFKRLKDNIFNVKNVKNILSIGLRKLRNLEDTLTCYFSKNQKILFRESIVLSPTLPLLFPFELPSGSATHLSQIMNRILLMIGFTSASLKLRSPALMKFSLPLQLAIGASGAPINNYTFHRKEFNCDNFPQDLLCRDYPPSKTSKNNMIFWMISNGTKIVEGIAYSVAGKWDGTKRIDAEISWNENDDIFDTCLSLPQILIDMFKHVNASSFLTTLNNTCEPQIIHGNTYIARFTIHGFNDGGCQESYKSNDPNFPNVFVKCYINQERLKNVGGNAAAWTIVFLVVFLLFMNCISRMKINFNPCKRQNNSNTRQRNETKDSAENRAKNKETKKKEDKPKSKEPDKAQDKAEAVTDVDYQRLNDNDDNSDKGDLKRNTNRAQKESKSSADNSGVDANSGEAHDATALLVGDFEDSDKLALVITAIPTPPPAPQVTPTNQTLSSKASDKSPKLNRVQLADDSEIEIELSKPLPKIQDKLDAVTDDYQRLNDDNDNSDKKADNKPQKSKHVGFTGDSEAQLALSKPLLAPGSKDSSNVGESSDSGESFGAGNPPGSGNLLTTGDPAGRSPLVMFSQPVHPAVSAFKPQKATSTPFIPRVTPLIQASAHNAGAPKQKIKNGSS